VTSLEKKRSDNSAPLLISFDYFKSQCKQIPAEGLPKASELRFDNEMKEYETLGW
jgi:hypothetical protein